MKKLKSRAAEVLSGKSKPRRQAHRVHVRKAANGGFIAENHYKPEEGEMTAPESEEHSLPDMQALQQHMADHMGGGEQAPEQGGGEEAV